MCPLFSCCHRRNTQAPCALRRQLYYVVRLLLASAEAEVPGAQQPALQARLDGLWASLHEAMQHYYRVPASRAFDLTAQVVHALLREACCRRALQQTIALEEALNLPPAAPELAHYQ